MDWSHIKKRGWRDIKSCPILEPSGKQEDRKTEKQLENIGNQGSRQKLEWTTVLSSQQTEVERTHRQLMFLEGTMDLIIIIINPWIQTFGSSSWRWGGDIDTVVSIVKISIFWDAIPCHLAHWCQCLVVPASSIINAEEENNYKLRASRN